MSIKKTPEYQLESSSRYHSKCKKYSLVINPEVDPEVIEKLESVENRSGYIKGLIRKDLKMNYEVRFYNLRNNIDGAVSLFGDKDELVESHLFNSKEEAKSFFENYRIPRIENGELALLVDGEFAKEIRFGVGEEAYFDYYSYWLVSHNFKVSEKRPLSIVEYGEGLYFDGESGYQMNRGQRIALTSFGAFGQNYPTNVEDSQKWEKLAKRAYHFLIAK